MAKKVFISFDYENDKHYKFILTAINANPRFNLVFDDKSSTEINSYNIGRIKAALAQKIADADYTLVIVGKYANSLHRDRELIGCRNWINFEINKSKELHKKLIAVKIDRSYDSPEELLNSRASWAMSFTVESITEALDKA